MNFVIPYSSIYLWDVKIYYDYKENANARCPYRRGTRRINVFQIPNSTQSGK
jgi:hypothetical protein